MTRTTHLIVGPDHHGVPRHGEQIAEALDHPVVRLTGPDEFSVEQVRGAEVVHIPYTDRLFAARCEDSAKTFERLTASIRTAGAAVSVTLHDLPVGESALEIRRRAAYRRVVADARGVVVNSRRELTLLDQLDDHARSRRRISLPVPELDRHPAAPGPDVVVLGFVFPDRGYEHTIGELPDGVDLVALGAPAIGHENLLGELAGLAARAGRRFRTTGFVPDDALAEQLARAGVPVAPNRRVAASASIASWLGHGRRPLVPDTAYTRELVADWPGTVTLYDPAEPGALRAAIASARADPSLTFLAPGTRIGPSVAEVATAYADHFAATAPDRALVVGGGRWTVPGNRWDLLDGFEPVEPPRVSVVIPYFEAQAELDRVLSALTLQTHPVERLQVVVADDGSAIAPGLGRAAGLEAVLVRQPDQGFRAAAARNLGAAAADGDVLLFLDGDTVPEPDYVTRMIRLPAIAPEALVVGHRRHADFSTDPPRELPEPGWLLDGYRDSADLLRADARSYRYIISAVMGMHRELFAELGGFSAEFTSYGGEDWELAHRAYAAGAVLAHIADAVAWHDGPDWAGRAGAADKNPEALALARLLPDPVARGGGQWLPYPAAVLRLATDDDAAALATVRSAFASGADCGFWIESAELVDRLGDARIRTGPVPPDVLARASVTADLVPADLAGLPDLLAAAAETGRLVTPAGTFTAHRAQRRVDRWAADLPEVSIATLFGHREVAAPVPFESVDLAHQLTTIYRSSRRS